MQPPPLPLLRPAPSVQVLVEKASGSDFKWFEARAPAIGPSSSPTGRRGILPDQQGLTSVMPCPRPAPMSQFSNRDVVSTLFICSEGSTTSS